MIKKSEVVNHFHYNWWSYVAYALVIVIVWVAIFNALAQPKDYEKIGISYVGENLDCDLLAKTLYDEFPNLTEQKIKKVNTEKIEASGIYTVGDIISTRVLGISDFILWEGDVPDGIENFFVQLDQDKIQSVLGEVEFCMIDGKAYGFMVYDGHSNINFADIYSGSKQVWVFVSGASVNFAGTNGNSSEYDSALVALKYLMEQK